MKSRKQDDSYEKTFPRLCAALSGKAAFPTVLASSHRALLVELESVLGEADPRPRLDALLAAPPDGPAETPLQVKDALSALHRALSGAAGDLAPEGRPAPRDIDEPPDPGTADFGACLAACRFQPEVMRQRFPHALARIEKTWNTADCLPYLDSLLVADRSGRQGFPPAAISEILFIKNLLESRRPDSAVSPHDPFSRRLAEDSRATLRQIAESARRRVDHESVADAASDADAQRHRKAAPRFQEIQTIEELQAALAQFERGQYERVPKRLGEILVDSGQATPATIEQALARQQGMIRRTLLGEILVGMHALKTHQVIRALCRQLGVPIFDLGDCPAAPEVIRIVPLKIARMKAAYPLLVYQRRLVVAVSNPFEKDLQDYFSFLSGTKAILIFADPEQIHGALRTYGAGASGETNGPAAGQRPMLSGGRAAGDGDDPGTDHDPGAETDTDAHEVEIDENDESLIGLVNKIINDAIRVGASDIHLEAFPNAKNAQVRLRRDGRMERHQDYPIGYHSAVVSRIKIMASLDISERRKAQDGKINFGVGRHRQDLRVSTIPTANALEVVTIRILAAGRPIPLARLGMNQKMLDDFGSQIEKPYGLILVCGPTGSGKTTTLHSALHQINTPDRKIWTAEDPIEIVQHNISQVQMHPKIGWTFALALRAFLRADPDVIMIGEIRDAETAKVAVEASMTGHLVLATLHTNSAVETLARILDLGVSPFNLADAMQAVMAQRLARRICKDCGQRYEISDDEIEMLVTEYFLSSQGKAATKSERDRLLSEWRERYGVDGRLSAVRAIGCDACHGSGYRGRQGIYEFLQLSPEVRRLVRTHATTGEIFKQAYLEGMRTLRQDGIEKVIQGITDFREVRSVCL